MIRFRNPADVCVFVDRGDDENLFKPIGNEAVVLAVPTFIINEHSC